MFPEITGNEHQYSVGRFAAFFFLFLPLEVFCDDDSLIPLLIGYVIVALRVVVSDVYYRTFINIEID